MNNFYTYAHNKPDGSIFYIGKGIGDRAFSDKNRNIHWHRTVQKYGYEVNILANWDTEEQALDHEKLLISCFKDMKIKLVNLTNGGEGSAGYRWTDEQKANFDTSGSKNAMYGKKHTETTKRKLSEKAKGRVVSDIAKAKISEKMKNRQFSESHLEKLRISRKGNKNGIGNKGNAKKCEIDGVIYNSTQDASKVIGISANAIQKRCKNVKYQNYQYI
jgi:group I intron endonuclease